MHGAVHNNVTDNRLSNRAHGAHAISRRIEIDAIYAFTYHMPVDRLTLLTSKVPSIHSIHLISKSPIGSNQPIRSNQTRPPG